MTAVPWTRDRRTYWNAARRQQPRTGWNALLYAAVRWPGNWFTRPRFLWLLCIAISGSIIWLAGSHLGPALRAAHGQGIAGQWTAQEQDGGQWYGEFASTSGTVTLPHVYYAGSLPAVQAGTVTPALDTGAGDEVYPLTGSGKWIHDVIGVVAGSLALIALLAMGLFTSLRRRRARRADGFTQGIVDGFRQGMLPTERERRPRRAVPRTRAGKLAVLALSVGATGWVCDRFIMLLADVRPYVGWYWLLAVAGGIVIAVALPWAAIHGVRRSARWLLWLLLGYIMALAGGTQYYLSLGFTPPSSVPAVLPPPSLQTVLEIAGLSAVTLTYVAITLLLLAVMVDAIVPGRIARRRLARR